MQSNFDELLQKAEKLRAEIDGNVEMPRVERNLKQLAEVGNELWTRTAYNTSRDSCDIRASVMLGSMGYDLQKVSQHLESLTAGRRLPTLDATKDTTDIQSFLKAERENAVLSVVEEVKRSTFDLVDRNYWTFMNRQWVERKQVILNALVGQNDMTIGDMSMGTATGDQTPPMPGHESRLKSLIGGSTIGSNLSGMLSNATMATEDIEHIITQVAVNKERNDFEADANTLVSQRDKHSRALELLINHLSPIVAEKKTPGSKRERLELFALKVAEKFSTEGHNATKELAGVLYLLLDLMTVFDYYHNQAYADALDTIQRLNILPFRHLDIKLKVSQFGQFSEEIRRNIPDLLIATMNILHAQYKEAKYALKRHCLNLLINESSD